MDEWYYAVNGAQQGPITRNVLMQLLSSGQVPQDTLVWREGMPNWIPAHSVAELVAPSYAGAGQSVGQQVLGYGLGQSNYQQGVMEGAYVRYAGFWIRFAAAFIDGLVIGIPTVVIMQILAFAVGYSNPNAIIAISGFNLVFSVTARWLYFAMMHSSARQATLGMMACGMRVTDMQGQRITFGLASGRFFASLLSGCILCIGFFMIAWTEKKQSLHDIICGTLVIMN